MGWSDAYEKKMGWSDAYVRDFKKKHELNSAIRVEANQNCVGFEVRIVRKMKSKSEKQAAYESSGVLKFLGEVLVIILEQDSEK